MLLNMAAAGRCPWLLLVLYVATAQQGAMISGNEHNSTSLYLSSTRKKPNIVILFADNLGYNDVGCFGAPTARTPNIDRLSYEGVKLHHWNSAAHLCSASRAALLTGRYPARTGVYPGVFHPDAEYGLMPNETTLAEYLRRDHGYVTSIVGKWHLGHREEYLPTNRGFDSWFGIPYHMSGGSLDAHVCTDDVNSTMWLPLFDGTEIVEQPVDLTSLAQRYASEARSFIERNSGEEDRPFFLYLPFSHVHQLCSSPDTTSTSCQWASRAFSDDSPSATFADAVEEMDWIAGEVLDTLDSSGVTDETLVLFTSDNGPWVAVEECSGSKGPFEGRWLQENVDPKCTACPHGYVSSPTPSEPRRCIYPSSPGGTDDQDPPARSIPPVNGVPCGTDTGLGSTWEANLRMPALARWPGRIPPHSESDALVSTLDVLPTVLSIVGGGGVGGGRDGSVPLNVDGLDITCVLTGERAWGKHDSAKGVEDERVLFFWRDGFRDGPLPAPYGRLDVTAVKLGRIKAWFYTKSGHYNDDEEVYHDPPLLFDVWDDPAEAFPLNVTEYRTVVERIRVLLEEHKANVDWTGPLTLGRDRRFVPCIDEATKCRTTKPWGPKEGMGEVSSLQ